MTCATCGCGFDGGPLQRYCSGRCSDRAWYLAHREQVLERRRAYSAAHRDQLRERRNRSYRENRDVELARQRAYDRARSTERRLSRIPADVQARIRRYHADGYGRQTIAKLCRVTPDQVGLVLDQLKPGAPRWTEAG